MIRESPKSDHALCFYASTIGQLGAIAGFATIEAGAPLKLGGWVATGSLMVKLAALAYHMKEHGVNAPFGNSRTVNNLVFRVGFLSGGGTIGGILLALSSTIGSNDLAIVGACILGLSIFVGTAEVLYWDANALL